MDIKMISRAALGRVASLGDLYDARRENFCGVSIFSETIPERAVTLVKNPNSQFQLVQSDSFREKFFKLDVNPDMQVSIIAGLPTLQGSGMFLKDRRSDHNLVRSSLIYNIRTKDESFNMLHPDVKNILKNISFEGATHVVTGIKFGAVTIFTFVANAENLGDVKIIRDHITAQLEKLSLSITSEDPSGDTQNSENEKREQFQINVFGDILPTNRKTLETLDDCSNFMGKVWDLIVAHSEGKGVPITFQMCPISAIYKEQTMPVGFDVVFKSTAEETSRRIVNLFDQMCTTKEKIGGVKKNVLTLKCVAQGEVAKLSKLQDEMKTMETYFKTELSTTLIDMRYGKCDESQLLHIVERVKQSKLSPKNVLRLLTEWQEHNSNMHLANELVRKGATYISSEMSLDDEISMYEGTTYIFFFSKKPLLEDPDNGTLNKELFFQLMTKQDEEHKYYAIDCDIHENLNHNSGCRIQVVKAGKIVTDDLLAEKQQRNSISFAQIISGTESEFTKPKKRALLAIPCTGQECNASRTYEWSCRKCMDKFEYGFDRHVYCTCGKSPAIFLQFKCTDLHHGSMYTRHESDHLLALVSSLEPFHDLNILILGETGVGKSTWINGFMNFLTYDSLEEAENGELCTLIPSQFTVCDDNFKQILVATGTDDNEVLKVGRSATQKAKVYPFNVGNTTIRLIDTPGIGDTRGIEQDKTNFQNIMSTLSYLDEIHGICILLKPNNARLNIMFRFCIKELLTNLHRDASKNIMFCFTNSRGTFYRPGDTMPALIDLLSENKDVEIPVSRDTVYCYDSEAYRFLAAVKNDPPVNFPPEERKNFANSWEKSIAETNRMLEYIRRLTPHNIKSTVNLNQARELVLKLSRPLAEISRNIQTNKSIVEDERKELEKTKLTRKALKKKQMTTRTEIEIITIPHPKTVCSNSNCVRIWTVNNVSTTEYVTICHGHCHLSGVTKDSIGDIGLIKCKAMNKETGYCKMPNCGHSYREHLHVYYDSIQVAKEVVDEAVVQALQQNLNATEMKQKMIDAKNQEIEEYEYELKRIEQASVQFAYFLKTNAITPYNDAMEQYLNHLIREEEEKIGRGGSATTLGYLRSSKESYIREKLILEHQMEKGGMDGAAIPIGPADIQRLVGNLQKLRYAGNTLVEALQSIDQTANTMYSETTVGKPKYNTVVYNEGNSRRSLGRRFLKGLVKISGKIFNSAI